MVGGFEPGGCDGASRPDPPGDEPLSGSSGKREPSIDARQWHATRSSGRSGRQAERTAAGAPVRGARHALNRSLTRWAAHPHPRLPGAGQAAISSSRQAAVDVRDTAPLPMARVHERAGRSHAPRLVSPLPRWADQLRSMRLMLMLPCEIGA